MESVRIWGIAAQRIIAFAAQQEDLVWYGEGRARCGDAELVIESLEPRCFGYVCLPRTRVRITGGSDAERLERAIYLNFLSAGG